MYYYNDLPRVSLGLSEPGSSPIGNDSSVLVSSVKGVSSVFPSLPASVPAKKL